MRLPLALTLKEAGFPQAVKKGDRVHWVGKFYIHLGGGHNGNEGLYAHESFTCCLDEYNKEDSDVNINHSIRNIMDEEVLLIPTLEELIAACERDGYFSFMLTHDLQGNWVAMIIENSSTKSLQEATLKAVSDSAEEAVSTLWLALSQTAQVNNCDGCQRGLPILEGDHFKDGRIVMGCTKDLY